MPREAHEEHQGTDEEVAVRPKRSRKRPAYFKDYNM